MGQEQVKEEITPQEDGEQEYVYLLELQNGKYYVGRTNNVTRRVQQHNGESDAEWVRLHCFVRLISSQPISSRLEEDLEVKKAMLQYGIDNVRGGTYSTIFLSEQTTAILKQELVHAEDKCFNCGGKDHYLSACPLSRKASQVEVEKSNCTRCGRNTHTADKCFAVNRFDGAPIVAEVPIVREPEKKNCTKCGRNTHTAEKCFASLKLDGTPIVAQAPVVKANCARCGRNTHGVDKCFATNRLVGTAPVPEVRKAAPPVAKPVAESTCIRCGRNNHTLEKCNAFAKYDGTPLCSGVTKEGNKCRLVPENGNSRCKYHRY